MLTVTFEKDARGKIFGATVEGHATYVEPGEYDIVCSGVSVLTITVVNSLEELLGYDLRRETDSGYMRFVLPADCDDLSVMKADFLMDTYALGIRAMAEVYGDYIRVSEKMIERNY